MSNEDKYGKEIYASTFELSPGTKLFFSVKEKEGIKYPSFSSYGGWNYQTKWGAQGKRFPMNLQGITSLIDTLQDIRKVLEG